jgi:hypothetical protein
MAVVKLTARNIATLPGQLDRRVDYVDAILRGFTLRVPPSGSRTFAVRYFLNGKVQRYTIGPTPPLSLAVARDLARRVLGRRDKRRRSSGGEGRGATKASTERDDAEFLV